MNVTGLVECAGRKVALELRDYLRILLRRGWIILFVALLAAGLSILPMAVIRYLMSYRPRSVSEDDS